jgi:hypothetical protein
LPKNIKKENIDFTKEIEYLHQKRNFYLDDSTDKLEDIFRVTLRNKSKYIFIDYIQLVEVE